MAFVAGAVLDSRAAAVWRDFGLEVGFRAGDLLDHMGLGLLLDVLPDAKGQRVLGALIADERCVVLNEAHFVLLDKNDGLRRFTIGHEVGHWLLHNEAIRAGTVAMIGGNRTWCRSGSGDIERQAEMFAGRLLVPQDRLAQVLPLAAWRGWPAVYRLAEHFVVTPSAMLVRLEELRLAHRDEDGLPMSGLSTPAGQGVLFPD